MTDRFTVTRAHNGDPNNKGFVYNEHGSLLAVLSLGETRNFGMIPGESLGITLEQPIRTEPHVTASVLESVLGQLDIIAGLLRGAVTVHRAQSALILVNDITDQLTEIQAATIIHPDNKETT